MRFQRYPYSSPSGHFVTFWSGDRESQPKPTHLPRLHSGTRGVDPNDILLKTEPLQKGYPPRRKTTSRGEVFRRGKKYIPKAWLHSILERAGFLRERHFAATFVAGLWEYSEIFQGIHLCRCMYIYIYYIHVHITYMYVYIYIYIYTYG